MAAASKKVPFAFVLDWLDPLSPTTRPMFGATGVYVGEQIVFILREKEKDVDDGVWLATEREHHESLRRDLPSIRDIEIFGPGPSAWQILRSSEPTFESEVTRACELVLARDPRLGKLPASKRPKPVKTKENRKRQRAAGLGAEATKKPPARTVTTKQVAKKPAAKKPTAKKPAPGKAR